MTDSELVAYIRQQREKFRLDDIRRSLLNDGIPVARIDEAMVELRGTPSPAPADLGMEAPSLWRRAAALTLDLILLWLPVFFATTILFGSFELSGLAALAGTAAPLTLYFAASMLLMDGQTPGKKLAALRVVNLDGSPLSPRTAFIRSLSWCLSAAPCGIGFIPALYGPEAKALHDRIAGTRVVAERPLGAMRAVLTALCLLLPFAAALIVGESIEPMLSLMTKQGVERAISSQLDSASETSEDKDFRKIEDGMRKALDRISKHAPERDDLRARALFILGSSILMQGRRKESIKPMTAALDIQSRRLDKPDDLTLNIMRNLATAHAFSGNPAKAVELARESLRIRLSLRPAGDPDIAISYHHLGSFLKMASRPDEARAAFESALAIRRKTLGPEHESTRKTRQLLDSLPSPDLP